MGGLVPTCIYGMRIVPFVVYFLSFFLLQYCIRNWKRDVCLQQLFGLKVSYMGAPSLTPRIERISSDVSLFFPSVTYSRI